MLTFGFIVLCFPFSSCSEVHCGTILQWRQWTLHLCPLSLEGPLFCWDLGRQDGLHDDVFLCEKSFLAITSLLKKFVHARLKRVRITWFLFWKSDSHAVCWILGWLCYLLSFINTSVYQSQVRIRFCQHSTDTIQRRQLLTLRSVLFLDFETKAVGYRKIELPKATMIGSKISISFLVMVTASLVAEKIHNENLEDTKRHSECLWRSYLFRSPPKRVAPGPWL